MHRFSVAIAAMLVAFPLAAQSTTARKPPRDLPLTAAARARYVGHYSLTDSSGRRTPLSVYEENGTLFAQMRANTPARLLHESANTFRLLADALEFTLAFTVAGGRASAVRITGPGTAMRGVRDSVTRADREAADDSASRSGPLHDELARMDSLIFDASYVQCDTARIYAMLTDDIEFYHDVTGLNRGAEVRADFARLAKDCPQARGIRRELVPGSLRVYPIEGFGAVKTGMHRFIEKGAPSYTVARFVEVWKKENGAWKAARILSLDHQQLPVH